MLYWYADFCMKGCCEKPESNFACWGCRLKLNGNFCFSVLKEMYPELLKTLT